MKTNPNAGPYCPLAASYSWQDETREAFEHIATTSPGKVSHRDAMLSLTAADPALVMMDSAIRWIKAYRARFEQPVADDYMASPEISGILSGIRGLLNFDGGAKMERDARDPSLCSDWTDSKENGMIESLYWKACELAGIDGDSI